MVPITTPGFTGLQWPRQESGLPLSYDPEILREYFDGLPGLQFQRRRVRPAWDLCLGSLFWDGKFMEIYDGNGSEL